MSSMRVGIVQLSCGQDRDHNLSRAAELMTEAVRANATVIALPENLSYIGKEKEKMAFAEDAEEGPTVRFLKSFAAEHSVTIIGGTIPLKTDDESKVTNTCLVFDPGGNQIARYDKIHLFDVAIDDENTFEESRYVRPGESIVSFSCEGFTVGLSICYDLRFPELYRSLALGGAQVLFVPSAFTRETGRDHWEVLLRARSIENQCYVAAPAQVGNHGMGKVSFGRSMVVSPWGTILAQCSDDAGVLVAEIHMEEIEQARRRLGSLDHVRLKQITSIPTT